MNIERDLVHPVSCVRWIVVTIFALGVLCPLRAQSQVPPRFYWKTLSGANAVPLIVRIDQRQHESVRPRAHGDARGHF